MLLYISGVGLAHKHCVRGMVRCGFWDEKRGRYRIR